MSTYTPEHANGLERAVPRRLARGPGANEDYVVPCRRSHAPARPIDIGHVNAAWPAKIRAELGTRLPELLDYPET
jgi:hypothetical protein